MPRINQREALLLKVFGGLIALAVIVVAITFFQRWVRTNRETVRSLQEQVTKAQFWMERQEELNQKEAWLEEYYRPIGVRNDAVSDFIEQVQAAAARYQLELSGQDIIEPEQDSNNIRMRVAVTSTVQPLVQWLNELQKPEDLIAIPQFELRAIPSEEENVSEKVKVDLIIEKHFPGDAVTP